MSQPAMKDRMAELKKQKVEIEARLSCAARELADVNTNVAELCRRKIALTDSQASQEASVAIRSLIGDVVLTPGERRGEVNATLRSELMAILDFVCRMTIVSRKHERTKRCIASSGRTLFAEQKLGCCGEPSHEERPDRLRALVRSSSSPHSLPAWLETVSRLDLVARMPIA